MAVALAVNQPNMKLIAVNSGPALHLAKTNAYRHGVNDRIDFRRDLLHPVSEQFDLLVANLPISSSEVPKADGVGRYEPHEALDGGLTVRL